MEIPIGRAAIAMVAIFRPLRRKTFIRRVNADPRHPDLLTANVGPECVLIGLDERVISLYHY
jgi:hypothetical protein